MTKRIIHRGIVLLILFLFILSGCMTGPATTDKKVGKGTKPGTTGDSTDTFEKHPELLEIFKTHEITELPADAGEKFVNLYILTRKKEYLPKGNRTFCTKFFYDYFYDIGYEDLLTKIRKMNGKNMVEKVIRYAEETGEIEVLLSGYEAQKLANEGRDVGVLGEYYYDKAERNYTVHYSVVQPSNIAFDDQGNEVPYYVTGCLTNRKDVNNRYGTGTFLAQAGIAVGLIDFRWAYNRQMNGIIQRDSKGNFRGGIIFIVFPEKGKPFLGISRTPKYYLHINVEPGDVSLSIDGIPLEDGTRTLVFMKQGEHILRATSPGYKEIEKQIIVGKTKKTTVTIDLEEYKGKIRVTSTPEKAEVFVDGKKAGESPCLISDLSFGEYQVSIRLPGYVSVNNVLQVDREEQKDMHLTLDKYEMIPVAGGTLVKKGQGSEEENRLTVPDLFISNYEVTGEQYEEYCVSTGTPLPDSVPWNTVNTPVTGIDWYDAVEYCNWLSIRENLIPCYEIKREIPDPGNQSTGDTKKWKVIWNREADGYRLPTEAEWEFAALGGIKSKGYIYAGSNSPDDVSWYADNSAGEIQPVGKRKPNEAGLYDMSGNAWEWCWDWYSEESGTLTSPGPESGSGRIRKGGSAFNTGNGHGYLKVVSRHYLPPDNENRYTGFRVARGTYKVDKEPEPGEKTE